MKRLAAALLLSAISAAPALAADAGGYVALDIGTATFKGADFAGVNSNATFSNPGSFHITGGYHFDQNLGIEGGLVAVGDSIAYSGTASETLKTSAVYIAAVGTLPLSDQFDLFGKLGLASTKIDYASAGFATNVAVNGSKTNLMFGIGGQFNFSRNWGLRVQYENFGKTDLNFPAGWVAATAATKSIGLSTFTVGGVYNF